MFTKKTRLYHSVSAAALAVMASGAMSAPAGAQEDSMELEEIVVSGIRGGLRAALDVKRNSNGIVDAISAEDIGKFPDKNVAESLQRIPGITIQRAFGEGSDVSIRGAGSGFTKTTLNGQNVASTGWFVFEPARRSFNYTLLPSELVGSVEVYKSSQADLLEGGVGGTVTVNTRKPLDMDNFSIYASVEGSHQDDSDKIDPQASGLFSWKNDDETLGLLVSGVYQKRNLQRQGNEAFWEWGAGPVAFEQDRERRAITGTVQYRPNENLDVVLNYVNMEMAANNTNYAMWLTQGNTTWSGVEVPEADKISETPARGPLGVAFFQARPREATMKSRVYDMDITYAGEGYVFDFQVGRTEASGGTDFEMVVDDGLAPALNGTYDFFGGEQTWDTGSFDMSTYDPGTVVMGLGENFNRTPKKDAETYIQADFERDVDYGVINSIKVGARYSDHNTKSRRYVYQTAEGFDNVFSTAGLLDGTIEAGAGNYEFLKLDAEALKDLARAAIVGETEDLGAYSEIDERNFAAYAMATFEGDGFRGNAGLRWVNTDATSTYYLDGQQQETDASYSEFLPSFNIAIDAAEDVIVRASAARVLTRPQYVDMYVNPNVTGTNDDLPANQFWIVGNVGLQPFVSNQLDLSVEWYFAEGSILSGGIFFKDVKNFVTVNEYEVGSSDIPFDLPDPDEAAAGWTVQELENGGSADLKGFELQYQQDYGNGFGSIVNYTYTDSDVSPEQFSDANPVVTDSSRHAFNVSGYYENELFNVRASYNYRSKYMMREVGAYGNRLHNGYGSLDLSGKWFANENITVSLDVNNLLKQDFKQFGNNQVSSPNSGFADGFPLYQYETARRITLGVSFKY
ncbi:TonB-dependent receptor [Kordiimonas sediminis]|uniref:TonB-dependent receptor n=1 Tax=Kordiimonas sediminis TaxID=1735581 RepID=A0A919AMD2_9PROT|nr:TonB-dependent receptor [Kordiimonas sediminis]GHF13800.1 TonB-dependent receptor [Kordiimonas sediminis]